MPSEKQIHEVFERVAADIPGFIAASLVDLESGMTLGVKTGRTEFDLTAASAYNSEMVKQKLKIMEVLGLHMDLEDMLLTLEEQIHLIRIINRSTFLYLAADRKGSNLAIVRNAVGQHVRELAG